MANTYLSRTPATVGNQKTFTTSVWVKRATGTIANGDFDSSNYIISYVAQSGSPAPRGAIWLSETGILAWGCNPSGSVWEPESNVQVNGTNVLFRDPSAWYHIVFAVDTTQATESNRLKCWVNGVQYSMSAYPAQNLDTGYNYTHIHNIGRYASGGTGYSSFLMSHFHQIDGTAYDASDFGETDATTGIWKPKTAPSVTYGTNGFFLKFENSGTMGTDSSPNGNNFTNNGMTQTVDTPSNVFATWNPLENYYQSATLSNGNTTIQTGNSQYSPSSSTLGVSSGKWYWEVEYDALSGGSDVAYVGVLSQFATNSTTSLGTNANDYGYYVNGNYYNNNTGTAYGTTYTTGDIIGVALDLDNNKLYFSKNGTWQNSGDPESGATGTGAISITNPTSTTNGAYFPSICDGSSSANATFKTNFGNGYFGTTPVASAGSNGNGAIFEFDCPSGYYALNTKNINTYG
jgi:hypothetical protein